MKGILHFAGLHPIHIYILGFCHLIFYYRLKWKTISSISDSLLRSKSRFRADPENYSHRLNSWEALSITIRYRFIPISVCDFWSVHFEQNGSIFTDFHRIYIRINHSFIACIRLFLDEKCARNSNKRTNVRVSEPSASGITSYSWPIPNYSEPCFGMVFLEQPKLTCRR